MVSVTYLPNADNICVPGCSWSSFPGDPGIYERLFPSLILFDDFFIFFSCSLSNTQLGQGRCRAPPWDGTSCGSDIRVTVFKTSSREGSGQLFSPLSACCSQPFFSFCLSPATGSGAGEPAERCAWHRHGAPTQSMGAGK